MCGQTRHRHHDHHRPARRPDPAPASHLRVGDAERDRAVELLRAHGAAGRLDVDELERRTGAALTATTRADLAALTRDLPRLPRDPAPRARARAAEVRVYALVIAALVVVWLATGAEHPWPLYPALGWGLPLLASRPRPRPRPARRLATRYVPAHTTPATRSS